MSAWAAGERTEREDPSTRPGGSAQALPTNGAAAGLPGSGHSCVEGSGAQTGPPLGEDLSEMFTVGQTPATLEGGLAGSFESLDEALHAPLALSRECSKVMDQKGDYFERNDTLGCLSLSSRQNSQNFTIHSQSDGWLFSDNSDFGREIQQVFDVQHDSGLTEEEGEAVEAEQLEPEQLEEEPEQEQQEQEEDEVEEVGTPCTVVGEKREWCDDFADGLDNEAGRDAKRARAYPPACKDHSVLTYEENELRESLLRSFGQVKDSKMDVFLQYGAFFRKMEREGVATALHDPQGREKGVFGWHRLQLNNAEHFFAEVDPMVRAIVRPSKPDWDRALNNFYEKLNELSIAPDGYRLKPAGGYFYRPSKADTSKRVQPKYEYNPSKANRAFKKKGWSKRN